MSKRFLSIAGIAIAAASIAGLASTPAVRAAGQDAVSRTVYVSVVDKEGAPVTDMQAADFEVKEGGKVQEIAAKPATAPLRVSILVADWGTGSFQAGMAGFMEKLLGHAEFQLVSVLPQPVTVTDFTTDTVQLSEGLNHLGQRGRQPGAQLLEAIRDTARSIPAEGKRAVILVLRIGNEGVSPLSGSSVRDAVRDSGAILEVVSVGVRTAAAPSAGGGVGFSSAAARAQMEDDEARQSAFALAQVMGDGSKETGGRNEHVISTTLVPMLESIADELLHQYEITYTLPAGQKPSDKLEVKSTRKDVTVRAPSRLVND
jgi:VWFA-related protein